MGALGWYWFWYEGRSENILTFYSFSKAVNMFPKFFLFVFKDFPTYFYTLLPSSWGLLYSLCKQRNRSITAVPIYSWSQSRLGLIFVSSEPLFQFWLTLAPHACTAFPKLYNLAIKGWTGYAGFRKTFLQTLKNVVSFFNLLKQEFYYRSLFLQLRVIGSPRTYIPFCGT